ncbi:hypothetical protein HDU93_009381, partial [Gonapodya sp. JEL0774]
GESGADVYDRISTFLESLHRSLLSKPHPPTVLVMVTHGLLARLFLMRWFHKSVGEFESWRNLGNGEMVVLERKVEERGPTSLSLSLPSASAVTTPLSAYLSASPSPHIFARNANFDTAWEEEEEDGEEAEGGEGERGMWVLGGVVEEGVIGEGVGEGREVDIGDGDAGTGLEVQEREDYFGHHVADGVVKAAVVGGKGVLGAETG